MTMALKLRANILKLIDSRPAINWDWSKIENKNFRQSKNMFFVVAFSLAFIDKISTECYAELNLQLEVLSSATRCWNKN